MRILLVLVAIGMAVTAIQVHPPGRKYDPTAVYQQEVVQGFTVLINPQLREHPSAARDMRQELSSQLAQIAQVVPAQPLSALRKVRIWVEWDKNLQGAAVFHPSVAWLQANGYNPAKAGSIELSNTRNFVKWSRAEQRWMVLHELAHAYHFLVLGENYAGIETAYQQAVQQKLYDAVVYINGGQRRAYARTNAQEYFAELSEAYFGKNDFYPFTHAELQKYDPVGYQLMEKVWGKIATPA
jgi:predicted metallopeptidase